MTFTDFKGLVVREEEDDVTFELENVTLDNLDSGDIIIKVAYSSINYKDMLAVQPNGGIVRNYPMIPGIDLSGVVVSSENPDFEEGQKVIATSYDIGASHTGGFAEYARINSEWAVPLPDGLSLKDAMKFGTAGFTAALSLDALEKNGMQPINNPRILVTGSTGGVGSIAVQMLSQTGYGDIKGLIRKDYQEDVAKELGATTTIDADDLGEKKTLGSRQFDFVLDTVGGEVTSTVLPLVEEFGSVSVCGNAGGAKLETTVLPFILRGINLLGINSVTTPMDYRIEIWNKIASIWNVADDIHYDTVTLDNLTDTFTALKEGKHLGRTIVEIDKNLDK